MTLAPWQPHLTSWRQSLLAASMTDRTIRTRMGQATHMARHVGVPPEQCRLEHLIEYSATQQWVPETRHGYHMGIRKFGAYLVTRGVWERNWAEQLPIVKQCPPLPRPAPDNAVRKALSDSDARVELMVLLASKVGLRRAEIAQIHTDDLVDTVGGWSLLVHGKGRKQRLLPLPGDIARRLLALEPGWVFPSPHPAHDHLTPGSVGRLVTQALPDAWSTHTLRHRFATVVYSRTKDVLAVQQLLGHASPGTTQRYVAVASDHLRAAVNQSNL